jgi:hypothetical protein
VKHTNQLQLFEIDNTMYIEKESDTIRCRHCNIKKDKKFFDIRNKVAEGKEPSRHSICTECKINKEKTVKILKQTNPFPTDPNYQCPLCLRDEKELRRNGRWKKLTPWTLDHCHDTEKFRGYICHDCNTALGRVLDSTDTLKRCIKYLEGKLT